MSWDEGAMLFEGIITSVKRHVQDEAARIDIYYDLMGVFRSMDCQTLAECQGLDVAFDRIYYTDTFIDEFKILTGADEHTAGKFAYASWFKYERKRCPFDNAAEEAIFYGDGTNGYDPERELDERDEDDEWPSY